MSQNFPLESHPVRITVLKKHFHQDFVAKYAANPDGWTECRHFEIGQQFEVSGERPWVMPEGFCGWAWADIQKLVYGMARGGTGDVRHLLHRRVPAGCLSAGKGDAWCVMRDR